MIELVRPDQSSKKRLRDTFQPFLSQLQTKDGDPSCPVGSGPTTHPAPVAFKNLQDAFQITDHLLEALFPVNARMLGLVRIRYRDIDGIDSGCH
jgi:hypothetical protein